MNGTFCTKHVICMQKQIILIYIIKKHITEHTYMCVYEFNYNTFNYPLDEVLGKNEYISKHLKKRTIFYTRFVISYKVWDKKCTRKNIPSKYKPPFYSDCLEEQT